MSNTSKLKIQLKGNPAPARAPAPATPVPPAPPAIAAPNVETPPATTTAATTSTATATTTTAVEAPKSWAALVAKNAPPMNPLRGFSLPPQPTASEPSSTTTTSTTKKKKKETSKNTLLLQPRGLINTGNKCFLNSVLQSLLACRPCAQFLNSHLSCAQLRMTCPVLDCLERFYSEFIPLPASFLSQLAERGRDENDDDGSTVRLPSAGMPVKLGYFYDLLPRFNKWTGGGGTHSQQDAQEFFTFLVDAIHSELCSSSSSTATRPSASSTVKKEETKPEEEWQEVTGKGNKSAVMVSRGDQFGTSDISRIFMGKLRSTITYHSNSTATNKKPSVTLQPFSCLHLPIASHKVCSVEDSLMLMQQPEAIDGYKDEKTGKVMTRTFKQVLLEELPEVLVLHLERFQYSAVDGEMIKLDKRITYTDQLCIKKANGAKDWFKLAAIVSHHGQAAGNGHYTADVLHAARWWLNCNDSALSWVDPNFPLEMPLRDDAYLLFYVRSKLSFF